MIPLDSQTKLQDILTLILNPNSNASSSLTISTIESFLTQHNTTTDQTKSFFTSVFPSFICKLFGFDGSGPGPGPGWIGLAQSDKILAGKIINLLNPNGVLFNAMNNVDKYELVKYVFPNERLPEWVKFMVNGEKDRRVVLSELCSLFGKERVKFGGSKGNVELNVFEYFMFWFAYYPVSKGNVNESGGGSGGGVKSSGKRFSRFQSWTVLGGGGGGGGGSGAGKVNELGVYTKLLYAYLKNFVGRNGDEVGLGLGLGYQSYRSSLLYSSGYEGVGMGAGSVVGRMEFMVNTFVHFWLVDNDFSPFNVNVCRSLGVTFPFRAVLGETPPTPGMGEVVTMFVKYVNSGLVEGNKGYVGGSQQSGSPRWGGLGGLNELGGAITSWNALIQRPLYRFILRTFLYCPMGTSVKNAYQVFGIWISYMEPWKMNLQDFAELDALIYRSSEGLKHDKAPYPTKTDVTKEAAYGYTSLWKGFVLSNYLYYSSLVMHFLGFAHKFLHADVEMIVQMVWKVLDVLASSKELMDLMKRVDSAFHLKASASSSFILDNSYKFVPSIREQLQDWEDGLSETDADGSFLHENWNQDLRLFSNGEDGGHYILQILILRMESEIQAIAGNNLQQNIKTLESVKSQMCILFGNRIGRSASVTPESKQCRGMPNEIFKPRSACSHKLTAVNYTGDCMKRPVSDYEITWLARLLDRLSDWLNDAIGLDQIPENGQKPQSWFHVDFDTNKVGGAKEAMAMILNSLGSLIAFLGLTLVKFMKEHNLRMNFRMLASKKVVPLLFLSAIFFSILKKVFGQC